MTNTIDNTDNILDSRDIIARIAALQEDDNRDEDEEQELADLLKLAEEGESESRDWQYGETLIRESYFVEYIGDFIENCYEMPKELHSGNWPWRHMTIDYDAAAREARQDYAELDFSGVTYLIRSS